MISPLSFESDLRTRIDDALAAAATFSEDCPARLAEAIRYSLLAPGKRLRPMLVLLAAKACGGEVDQAMPAAAAVEMIHAYSLAHDDLPAMDDDELRRGRPTCHRQFDEATAILVGDALQARAFEVIARGVKPPERAAKCCLELATAAGAEALVGGQADDLAAEFRRLDLDQLQSIHRRKTGAMFRVSLRLGAIAAGATDDQIAALTSYGEKIGLAFQIVDDLLDASGEEGRLGKRTGQDDKRGKATFPRLLGEAESRARAAALVAEAQQSVALVGEDAEPLRQIADFVMQRTY